MLQHDPRARRRVERHRTGADRAAEVRGSAQRVRAGRPEPTGLRRGALQSELRPLQPRRFRRRAARDQARAGARSVLRAAEVRAWRSISSTRSRSLDRARTWAGRPRRRGDRGFRVRHGRTRLAVRDACASQSDRSGARRQPAETPAEANPYGMAPTTCRRDCTSARRRASRALQREAPVAADGLDCSERSSRARVSTGKRWSGTARRGATGDDLRGRRMRRGARARRAGSRR